LAADAAFSPGFGPFGLLAKAEEEHFESLEKMKGCATHAVAEFKALDEAACSFRPLLGKRELVSELRHDPDGYRHVVKEEEESIKFYEEMAGKAEDEATRTFLMQLAEQEKRHLSIVENIYAFVESPRTYLAWGEFSNLKEY